MDNPKFPFPRDVGPRPLRGHRNRPLLPHRFLTPLLDLMLAGAEWCRTAASQLGGDTRWTDAADKLDAAAEALREMPR